MALLAWVSRRLLGLPVGTLRTLAAGLVVFHADPHAGNVLLLADGRLALLDFGSVGRLDAWAEL